MTDHPLTDAICEELADTEDRPFTAIEMDNMRAAADWQLEQVVEWLYDNLGNNCYLVTIGYCGAIIDVDYVIEDFRKAMRPTTTQENN
jgi:hypothetical protein